MRAKRSLTLLLLFPTKEVAELVIAGDWGDERTKGHKSRRVARMREDHQDALGELKRHPMCTMKLRGKQ